MAEVKSVALAQTCEGRRTQCLRCGRSPAEIQAFDMKDATPYRHDTLLLGALALVLASACGGSPGGDRDATASGGGMGGKVSGGAGGGGGTQQQTSASGASSGDPNPTRSLTTPDLFEGFWTPVRSRSDECAPPVVEDPSPFVDDVRLQNNLEQGYLEGFRCSGPQGCLKVSSDEYRFPIEQDGTVGEGVVIRGGQPPVEGEPCTASRTRYFLILSADRQTLEHVAVGERGPGVLSTGMCRYDHAAKGAGFACAWRHWVEFTRVSE